MCTSSTNQVNVPPDFSVSRSTRVSPMRFDPRKICCPSFSKTSVLFNGSKVTSIVCGAAVSLSMCPQCLLSHHRRNQNCRSSPGWDWH